MSNSIAAFATHEVVLEQLESIVGGWKDRDYDYNYNDSFLSAGNVTTNVVINQFGDHNSATGAGSIGTTFGA